MEEPSPTCETTIVRSAIYPAIGIARVGNSESEFFLAPEVKRPITIRDHRVEERGGSQPH